MFVIPLAVSGLLFIASEQSQAKGLVLTPEQKIYAIAKTVSSLPMAKNIFIVNHTFLLPRNTPVDYGVQYTLVVTKLDELKEEDAKKIYDGIGLLLKSTTKEVLVENKDIKYIAILFIPPLVWPVGFAESLGFPVFLYVAKRDELLALHEYGIEKESAWLMAAQKGKLDLVDSVILEQLMDAASNKNRGEDGGGFIRPR